MHSSPPDASRKAKPKASFPPGSAPTQNALVVPDLRLQRIVGESGTRRRRTRSMSRCSGPWRFTGTVAADNPHLVAGVNDGVYIVEKKSARDAVSEVFNL